MHYRTDIAYLYDGTWNGLMCCVFESFYKKELPSAIFASDEAQGVLYKVREIETDTESARRVIKSIPQKISGEAMQLVRLAHYSCMEEKELHILRFLRFGYKTGKMATNMITNGVVEPLVKAVRYVQNESHFYREFIRFSQYNGVLLSIIEPNNFVLPLIRGHFCDRFPAETFMIYDKTHRYALLHQNGQKGIMPLESLELPELESEELMYRTLWRKFYDTIAIEGRINHKCRRNHMPKRYWEHMTEFQTDKPVESDKKLLQDGGS